MTTRDLPNIFCLVKDLFKLYYIVVGLQFNLRIVILVLGIPGNK